MGLFDGAAHRRGRHRLRLHRARRRAARAPVMLVVDAAAQARSVAALVHGFRTFDPRRAARRGDPQPGRLRPARGDPARGAGGGGVPVLGAHPPAGRSCTPRPGTWAWCRRRSGRPRRWPPSRPARASWSPPRSTWTPSLALARSAPPLDALRLGPRRPRSRRSRTGPRIAVAGGPAFTFALRGERRTAGRRRRRGGAPSTRCATRRCRPARPGLVVGGGFPEVYAAGAVGQRAAARRRRRAGRAAARPIAAECAGLLYLGRDAGRRADVRRARRGGGDDARG